jgi:prepilin-type N-terminal cleavage/methylation domain-containing protein
MLSQLRQSRKEKGFTIIEVLIVLAIAGLILLVVFLAVPALQRNARNTQRRTDAGNLLSAVSEYVGNNSGTLPTTVSGGTATGIDIGAATGVNKVPVSLGYYDASTAGNVTLAAGSSGYTAVAGANATTTDTVVIVTGTVCTGNNATTSGASSRSVTIIYTLENNTRQCRAS